MDISTVIVTLVVAAFGSSGLWALLNHLADKRGNKKEELHKKIQELISMQKKQDEMLMAIGHDRVICLGKRFLQNGEISSDDYSNIKKMADAYQALGGNGEAKRIMAEVEKLPLKK